jgi:hypothetical protein
MMANCEVCEMRIASAPILVTLTASGKPLPANRKKGASVDLDFLEPELRRAPSDANSHATFLPNSHRWSGVNNGRNLPK